jgi:tetratricopeptide (TPR) repeat protein
MPKKTKKATLFHPKSLIASLALAMTSSLVSPALMAQESAEAQAITAKSGVDSNFVFRYLAAEIAGQRGELGISSRLFFDLAKSTRDPRLAERAAKVSIYSQSPGLALEATKLWVELNPDSAEAQQASTQMNVMTGNLGAAKPYLQKLLAKEETRANGFLYLNNLFANQVNKQAVLQLVKELAAPYQDLAEARLTTSQAAFQAGDFELALNEVTAANQLRPHWEIAAIQQADILYSQSPTEAIVFYKKFLEDNPDANDARLNLARILIKQQRVIEAKPELAKLAKLANSNPEILVVIGLLSAQSNELADAENYFKQALETDIKGKNQIYIHLGQIAERNNNDGEAINWYGMATLPGKDSTPQQAALYVEARISMANIIARTTGTDAAIALLDELHDLDNAQLAQVISAESNFLVMTKRYQESYDLLAKAVNNMPDMPDLIYDYAMAAERQQKFAIMETQLRKLIQMRPQFAQAYNALGYSFADRNTKLDEANKLITKALELSPNDHFIMDSMGWVLYRQGKLDKAYEYLNTAYTSQKDPEIAAHLGEVLWKLERRDEALQIWEEALSAYPENEVLVNAIKKFKR